MENFSSTARAWEDITLDNYLDTLESEVDEEDIIADDIRDCFYKFIDLGKKANTLGMIIRVNYNLQDLMDGVITFEDNEELITIYKEV